MKEATEFIDWRFTLNRLQTWKTIKILEQCMKRSDNSPQTQSQEPYQYKLSDGCQIKLCLEETEDLSR